MSSGKSTSLQGSAQKWAKPFAIGAANDTTGVYNAAQPGLNNLTSQVQGEIPGIIDKYHAGNPVLNAASAYDTNLLGRDPYAGSSQLEQLIHSTGQHVTDQVGAAYGRSGSFGGTPWAQALAHGLASNESGLRYQDAQNTMQMQQAASAGAPQKAAADYLGISPLLAAAGTGASLPYTGITALDSGLANLFNGGKSTQTTGTLGPIMSGLGSAAGAIALSDRRAKQDIDKIGEFPDGLGVYEFAYKYEPEDRYLGVMADEVAVLRPWALGPLVDGFATVDYGAL